MTRVIKTVSERVAYDLESQARIVERMAKKHIMLARVSNLIDLLPDISEDVENDGFRGTMAFNAYSYNNEVSITYNPIDHVINDGVQAFSALDQAKAIRAELSQLFHVPTWERIVSTYDGSISYKTSTTVNEVNFILEINSGELSETCILYTKTEQVTEERTRFTSVCEGGEIPEGFVPVS